MRFALWNCLLLGAALAEAALGAQPDSPKAQDTQDGLRLAAQLRSSTPPASDRFQGELKIRRSGRETLTVPITNEILVASASWQTLYQSCAIPGQPAEKLTVTHLPGQPNQYALARATERNPSVLSEPRTLTPSETAVPFAGSDFWLCDLGLEFFHWPGQRILKGEMRKGRACKVLESRPASPSTHPYGRVLSWIDNETGGLVMAEAYDQQGKRLKEFEVRSLKETDDRWTLKEVQIQTLPARSRTRMEFNLKLE